MRLDYRHKAAEVKKEIEFAQAEGTRTEVELLIAQALYNAYLNGVQEGRTFATFD